MGGEIKYEGDVLTDITSFSMVQNIFDGKTKVISRSQIDTLDSIIQLLVFYDNIWVVEPFNYGGEVKIRSHAVLDELVEKKIIKQYPQINSDTHDDFLKQYQEIKEIIKPETLEGYYKLHGDIAKDLQIYENNFGLSKDKGAQKMADMVGVKHDLIPLTANLVRTNFYFKLVQQMKIKENKMITYSPNILRSSLVGDIITHQNEKIYNNTRKTIQDQLHLIESSAREELKILGQKYDFNYEMELPLLTSLIIDQCKNNKGDFLDKILKMREDGDAKRLRKWLKELQYAISNAKVIDIRKKDEELKMLAGCLESPMSCKVNIKNAYSDPAWVNGSTQSLMTANPVPAVSGVGASLMKTYGFRFLDSLLNRDLYLLYKLNKDAKKLSFSKVEFEKLFNVELQV